MCTNVLLHLLSNVLPVTAAAEDVQSTDEATISNLHETLHSPLHHILEPEELEELDDTELALVLGV